MRGKKDIPKEAAHNVLQKSDRLLLDQLSDHVAEDSAHGIESLVCGTNVRQADVIEKNLLHNENGNGLAKFRAGLHDTKTEGNNLGGKEEVDNVRRVILHQGSDDA
jgi:hypothetical protein